MGVGLDTEELSTKVAIMKWRAFKGDKEGSLEFALAPAVRGVEGGLAKVLVTNGGTEKHGTEARGPAIRQVDEAIEYTWKKGVQVGGGVRRTRGKRRGIVREHNSL